MTRQRTPSSTLKSRSDWRALIDLARACVGDCERADDLAVGTFGTFDAANVRRMSLLRGCSIAQTDQLEREGGAVTGDLARAFVRIGRAWARPETSGKTRAGITPLLKASADWMDERLHAMATDDFQRAHAGRPEVA